MTRLRPLALVLLVALILTGCKKQHGVGDESLLDFEAKEQQRLGQASPTPSPTAPPPQGKQGLGQSPQPGETRPTEAPAIQVAINSDAAGSAFDPSVVEVTRGGRVSWANRDTVARSVEADDGSFKSGPIAPGGTWTWQATRSGKFGYHDGTRPYAVGSIEVIG